MKNPPRPGEIIRELQFEPLDLRVTQAAAGFGVSRKTLSMLLNGHAGISPETLAPCLRPGFGSQGARSAGVAIRLSKAFGRTPEIWVQLQMNCDLAQINQQADRIQVTRFGRPKTELMPAGA